MGPLNETNPRVIQGCRRRHLVLLLCILAVSSWNLLMKTSLITMLWAASEQITAFFSPRGCLESTVPQLLSFLLACSTCSCVHPPLDHKTKTGPQRDIPSAIKVGKMGRRGWQRILSPRRVSLSPLSPTPPTPTQTAKYLPPQISFPSSSLQTPLSLYSRSMPQDGDQSVRRFTGRPQCFTASLTAPPDPDSHQDISPGWLAGQLTQELSG